MVIKMSCFILSNENFEYMKEKIYKYMLSDEGSYLVYAFEDMQDYYKKADKIAEFVNKNVNYLHKINIKGVNERYNENDERELTNDIEVKDIYNAKLTDKELMQLYQCLRCLNYQIEIDFDNDFLIKVKNHIACTVTDRNIERFNDRIDDMYDTFEERYQHRIVWGF